MLHLALCLIALALFAAWLAGLETGPPWPQPRLRLRPRLAHRLEHRKRPTRRVTRARWTVLGGWLRAAGDPCAD